MGLADSAALGSRILIKGMRGKDVEQLIILLVRHRLLRAADIPSESLFDEKVEAAVKAFQRSNALTADGKVDYRTLLLLKAK